MRCTLQYWLDENTDVTITNIKPADARQLLDKIRWQRYELTNQTGYIYESQNRRPNPVEL